MENAKKAWSMILKDLKCEKKYFVWTFVYAAYMAFTIGFAVKGQVTAPKYLNPVIDGLFMMLIPFLGFYFNRRSFKYLTEDSYTQMLAFFRALPIPDQIVIAYRLIQIFLAYLINGTVFFGLMYFILEPTQNQMSLVEYLAFALTWIGYGMIMSGLYMYLELSIHGKGYFKITMLLILGVVVVAIIIRLLGGNMLLSSFELANRWSMLSPLMWGMLLAGAVSLVLFTNLTKRKLRIRDLV
ncbi:hypothetical protein [Paenibacillus azoreducens]|uniref:Uncharacterized protein n=1 Tax=Paenibacillus azoreducens TaxID=116718 RepID=A0A919YGJ9_9BACL|nr:hypothetical protein [Paenibacillus azoreducens]GIO50084.1 hypothetical protein J34TS1_48490 [Paenibacillus azoreducens]